MTLKRILKWLVLGIGLMPLSVLAADVVFLTHKSLPVVDELAKQVGQELKLTTAVKIVSEADGDVVVKKDTKTLVVVGPQALSMWKPSQIPSVAIFVRRAQVTNSLEHLHSALYLEPPVRRQVALAQEIVGNDAPIGMLAQSKSSLAVAGMNSSIRQRTGVRAYYLDDYDNINRALVDLLDECQVLVGQFDTELYSAENIKNILITAYRQNRPLIGPSSAYIRAGALATTYSDLSDVSKRLSEILSSGLSGSRWPPPGYNPHFKVRYNEQVARSLNLILPSAEDVAEALKRQEAR